MGCLVAWLVSSLVGGLLGLSVGWLGDGLVVGL